MDAGNRLSVGLSLHEPNNTVTDVLAVKYICSACLHQEAWAKKQMPPKACKRKSYDILNAWK